MKCYNCGEGKFHTEGVYVHQGYKDQIINIDAEAEVCDNCKRLQFTDEQVDAIKEVMEEALE